MSKPMTVKQEEELPAEMRCRRSRFRSYVAENGTSGTIFEMYDDDLMAMQQAERERILEIIDQTEQELSWKDINVHGLLEPLEKMRNALKGDTS